MLERGRRSKNDYIINNLLANSVVQAVIKNMKELHSINKAILV
jgi:hypothetical protein